MALERAKRKKCSPKITSEEAKSLIAACGIPFVRTSTLDIARSVMNTHFFVNHSEANKISKEEDWKFGHLEDGEEFFAVVLGNDVSL
jgi:hypothetical protein